MKMLLLFSLLISSSTFAQTILSSKKVNLPVNIDESNMKLSRAGYSSDVLKVFIPALADVTILDHRNENSGAPCMSTYEAFVAEDVIQGRPGVENIEFTIELTKWTHLDGDTCKVQMAETITANIRGFNFSHNKNQILPDRHKDDCR